MHLHITSCLFICFVEEEVAAIGDDGLMEEVRVMQACLRASHEVCSKRIDKD